jgi:hypothetical protein
LTGAITGLASVLSATRNASAVVGRATMLDNAQHTL